jgi:hypothetical protein
MTRIADEIWLRVIVWEIFNGRPNGESHSVFHSWIEPVNNAINANRIKDCTNYSDYRYFVSRPRLLGQSDDFPDIAITIRVYLVSKYGKHLLIVI